MRDYEFKGLPIILAANSNSMKKLVFLASLFAVVSFTTPIDDCCSKKGGRKCSGDAYCTACTNCSGCKHCKAGGKCGVCEKPKPKKKKKG